MLSKCQLVLATGGTVAQDLTILHGPQWVASCKLSLMVIDKGQQYGTDREIAVISLMRQQPLVLWTGDSEQTPGCYSLITINFILPSVAHITNVLHVLSTCSCKLK